MVDLVGVAIDCTTTNAVMCFCSLNWQALGVGRCKSLSQRATCEWATDYNSSGELSAKTVALAELFLGTNY